MEISVECRRPVGRPRRTWLGNIEADMAELEIYKEDFHDRKKWRGHVMKRKSNPIGKWTIKLPNIALQDEHSGFPLSSLTHTQDINSKGDE